jgi:RNA polymerase sigma-70 factor (ECF subfamily)
MSSTPQAVCSNGHGSVVGKKCPEDEELIRRLRHGDEFALEAVMRKYSSQLLSVAFRILHRHPDAEEVTQDVFWALWRSPERFDGGRGRLLTWLVILARSRALDRLRRIQANAPRENEITLNVLSTAPALVQLFSPDREIMIREVLERLPPEQGRVVQKAYFEGYALAEIAELQGAPVGTIKGRARFAIKKLRSELAGVTALNPT